MTDAFTHTFAQVNYFDGAGLDVEVIEVVRTRLEKRGKGTNDDPIRRITQYWSPDGVLLAEVDPIPSGEQS